MFLIDESQHRSIPSLIAGTLCFVVFAVMGLNVVGEDLKAGSRAALTGFQIQGIDRKCQQWFLTDAPEGWRKLNDQLKGFQVELAYNQQWENGVKQSQRNDWTLSVTSSDAKMLVLDKSALSVTGANERYSFQVRRPSQTSPYMVSKIQSWVPKQEQPLLGALRHTDGILEYARSIWWVPCEYILSNIGDKGFQIIGAHFARDSSGPRTAQIAFRYNGEMRTAPYCQPGATYWAEFLPEQNWAVIRSGVADIINGDEQLRIRVTSSYQDWFGGSGFPKEIVLAYENMSDNRIVEVRRARFGQPQPIAFSADAFYLPHYGISEASVQPLVGSRISWRIAINVIAIFLLLTAILIQWYIRRRAAVCLGSV